jgi:hypothetical protein
MKMDLSYWTKLNPNIIHEPTRKQYFGKYLYRLTFKAYGGRCIHDTHNVTIEGSLEDRKSRDKLYNNSGWWGIRHTNLDSASTEQLAILRSIKNGYGNNIRFRVEEPNVQIYADSEQTLRDIAERFNSELQLLIVAIGMPESESHAAALLDDKIIYAVDNGFNYKVFLRSGTYPVESQHQLAEYLQTVGPDISISKTTIKHLQNGASYLWGTCFFYTNDPSVVTMVNLICPGIVGKIHELVSKYQ